MAGAVSAQAQVANRSWLALTTVALYALIPHTGNEAGKIALPFALGEVAPIWFHGLVFSMLSVLAIVFASAHTQQVRAQKLAQNVIDSLGDSLGGAVSCLIHPREYFDIWRTPSLIRVAPLAQALQGKYQFFFTSHGLPLWRHRSTVTYYRLLKFVSLIVYFLLPILALWRAYSNASIYGVPRWLTGIGSLLAAAALILALSWDFIYGVNISRQLGKQAARNT
jgi:hypothetical protein